LNFLYYSGIIYIYSPRVARFVDVHEIDKNLKARLGSPEERTAYCLDKSPLLQRLIALEYSGSWEDLLGEVQLSFLLFLLLYSYPALEQWKALVSGVSSMH